MASSGRQQGSAKGGETADPEEELIPTEQEIADYAEYLGVNLDEEPELLPIVREGVSAPVPHPWQACAQAADDGEEVFYFNFETGESLWDHPCDAKYRQLVEEARKKNREGATAASGEKVEGKTPSAPESAALAGVEVGSSRSAASSPGCGSGTESTSSRAKEGKHNIGDTSSGSGDSEPSLRRQKNSECAGEFTSLAARGKAEAAEGQQSPRSSSACSSPKGEQSLSPRTLEAQKARLGPIMNELSEEECFSPQGPKHTALGDLTTAGRASTSDAQAHEVSREAPAPATAHGTNSLASAAVAEAGSSAGRGLLGVGLALRGTEFGAGDEPDSEEDIEESISSELPSRSRSLSHSGARSASGGDRAARALPPLQEEPSSSSRGVGVPKIGLACAGRPAMFDLSTPRHHGSSPRSDVSDELPSEFDLVSCAASSHGAAFMPSPMGDSLEFSATGGFSLEDMPAAMTVNAAATKIASETASERSRGGVAAPAASGPRVGAQDPGNVRSDCSAPASDLARWRRLEVELQSLSRSLSMLKDIKGKQQEYLAILVGGD